ncbi:MAG: 16S rRNA (adenine(1518)-N(6)/adenine(1519)-N(6))-dimethyltransferase RsmA [Deltaproteobacteria bacterium]|nr:16S rRNA (adenine(1518)-N(6)/adenine(1519)-N(6))-dimethyltransferase RsmA [Deltaproteobacteria bacterium]
MKGPGRQLKGLGLAPFRHRSQNFLKDVGAAARMAAIVMAEARTNLSGAAGGFAEGPGKCPETGPREPAPAPEAGSGIRPGAAGVQVSAGRAEPGSGSVRDAAGDIPSASAPEVLEVGPGLGALTRPLLDLGLRVRAVELDRGLCLQMSGWPEAASGALDLLCSDVLKLPAGSAFIHGVRCVCGNLPYGITTPFLFWFLSATGGTVPGVFMVQKEVAARLAAGPGTGDYGRLSVAMGSWFEVREAFTLGPGAFHPRPKVESAVAVLSPRRELPSLLSPEALGRMTRICFHSRRKTLINNLACAFPRGRALAALEALGLDGARRPEELTPLDYQRLTAELGGAGAGPADA